MDSEGHLATQQGCCHRIVTGRAGQEIAIPAEALCSSFESNSPNAMQLCREEELQSPQNQRSSRMRNIRRNGSAAPHNNWSPTVNAPRYCDPMFNLRKRPTGIFNVPVTDVGLSS